MTPAPIDDVLQAIRMREVVYCRSVLAGPWGIAFPPLPDHLLFHAVSHGTCWIELPGARACALRAGDLALLPHGQGHGLLGAPGQPATPLFDLPRRTLSGGIEEISIGSGPASAVLLCAAARFDDPLMRLLVAAFPQTLVTLDAAASNGTAIGATLALLEAESTAPGTGTETVVARLVELVIVQALREWARRESGHNRGWMAALQDRFVARAILRMHRTPSRDWTLASLARDVGLSRSALAQRFTTVMGTPPMAYLTRVRMNVAIDRLRQPDVTVAEVAAATGYASEAAFSRCFKRVIGTPPGDYRRRLGSRIPEARPAGGETVR